MLVLWSRNTYRKVEKGALSLGWEPLVNGRQFMMPRPPPRLQCFPEKERLVARFQAQ